MEREKLEEFNEWWFTGKMPDDLLKQYKRDLFSEIVKQIRRRQIISIIGLRRTGKTTIIQQVIDFLLKKGVKPKNTLYFSFDETVKELSDVLNTYREINTIDFRKEETFVFLDEIQKLNRWQDQLKKYYDLYPKIKFVISGSEGLFVKRQAKETMAGRITEFFLPPLSFKEFLELKGITPTPFAPKIKPEFTDYVMKGGLPEITLETDLREVKRYIKSSVIDKVIYKDLSQLAAVRDIDLMNAIIEIIATNPGMYLKYQSLAQQLDKDRRTIKEYVTWLREGFLIRLLGNHRKGRMAAMRKTKRAYVTDSGIITAFKPVIDDAFFSKIVETVIINAVNANTFWKNSYEVDAVIHNMPLEVKYKEKIIDSDLRGVREFMKKFKARKGILVTKNEEKTKKVKEGTITFVPAWKFVLNPTKQPPAA